MFRSFLICIFSVSMLAACGSKVTTTGTGIESGECSVPDEQANAFLGEWSQTPIKISFYSGAFSSGEKGAIEAAMSTWNNFYNAAHGFSLFEINGSESSLNQMNANCAGATVADGTVIYKRYSNWTRATSAAAVTSTCSSVANSNSSMPRIFNAIMEFNYQNFFNSLKRTDIESIALHELGHLMGLDHSCGSLKNNKSNVACPSGDPVDDVYVQSVMYPKVFHSSSGEGEIKRSLTANDKGRANCLYNN